MDCPVPVNTDCPVPVNMDCPVPVNMDCPVPVNMDGATLFPYCSFQATWEGGSGFRVRVFRVRVVGLGF